MERIHWVINILYSSKKNAFIGVTWLEDISSSNILKTKTNLNMYSLIDYLKQKKVVDITKKHMYEHKHIKKQQKNVNNFIHTQHNVFHHL